METIFDINKALTTFCAKQLLLDATNTNPVIIGEITHVVKNEIHYIYFTSTGDGAPAYLKRYHQFVVGEYLLDIYYKSSNVIDFSADYSIEDLQKKFKVYLNYLLDKL
jgi:hypothetical protein